LRPFSLAQRPKIAKKRQKHAQVQKFRFLG